MCGASGTQLNGEPFLIISKTKRHPSAFYNKLIPKALTKMSGGTNGEGIRFSFLIHTDQTGFIKGRYIGENIRLICDLLEKTKTDKSSGILLSIDFRKAFDTLE